MRCKRVEYTLSVICFCDSGLGRERVPDEMVAQLAVGVVGTTVGLGLGFGLAVTLACRDAAWSAHGAGGDAEWDLQAARLTAALGLG